jgi:hypothetical protein
MTRAKFGLATALAIGLVPCVVATEFQVYTAQPFRCSVPCEGYAGSDLGTPSELSRNSNVVSKAFVDGRFTSLVGRYESVATIDAVTLEASYWARHLVPTDKILPPAWSGVAEGAGERLERMLEGWQVDTRKKFLYAELQRRRQGNVPIPRIEDLIGPDSIFGKEFERSATPYDVLQTFVIEALGERLEKVEAFMATMRRDLGAAGIDIKRLGDQNKAIEKHISDLRKTMSSLQRSAASSSSKGSTSAAPAIAAEVLREQRAIKARADAALMKDYADVFDSIGAFCTATRTQECVRLSQAGKGAALLFAGIALIAAQQYPQGIASALSGLAQLGNLQGGDQDSIRKEMQALIDIQEMMAKNHKAVMRELARVNARLIALAEITIDLAQRDIAACSLSLDAVAVAGGINAPAYLRVNEAFATPNSTIDCLSGLKSAFASEASTTAAGLRSPAAQEDLWLQIQMVNRYLAKKGRLALGLSFTRLYQLDAAVKTGTKLDGGSEFYHRNLFSSFLDAPRVLSLGNRLAEWHFLYEITEPKTHRLLSPSEMRKRKISEDGKVYLRQAIGHVDLAISQQNLIAGHLLIPVLDQVFTGSIDEFYREGHPLKAFLLLPALTEEERRGPNAEALLRDRKDAFRKAFLTVFAENRWFAENYLRFRIRKELAASKFDASAYALARDAEYKGFISTVLPGMTEDLVWIDQADEQIGIRRGWHWEPVKGLSKRYFLALPSGQAVAEQEILYMPMVPELLSLRARLSRELASYEAPKRLSASQQQLLKQSLRVGVRF